MTDLHICTCGKSAHVTCTICDEWFCEACYEQKHPNGEHIAMPDSLENLEALYGPLAPFSEHKRDERIAYTSAEGERRSGEIIWVQAATDAIPIKYIVAPDDGGFLDFVMPGDVIT